MTRSEEELRVGKAEREKGRVRLRKYVVTEQVEQTVPVRREKARIEREPITAENVDQATSGPEISQSEHEVVLHEEEPVVEKRTAPKERVGSTRTSMSRRSRSPSRSARSGSRPRMTESPPRQSGSVPSAGRAGCWILSTKNRYRKGDR